MNTFMLTEYWPPTEEAYPAEHDAVQQAEQQLALQPQQAVAEQQEFDNNRGVLTRLQETKWSANTNNLEDVPKPWTPD